MTRKSCSYNKELAEKRRNERYQNPVKSWHDDPTGFEAVRNVMKSKQNINMNF